MKTIFAALPVLALAAAFLMPTRPAAADEDFWWGVAAGAAVGVIGSHVYHNPPVYHPYPRRERVIYRERPVLRERVIREQVPVAPEGSYVRYKEKKVWPFYRSTDVEIIPPLPTPPYAARPQAVHLWEAQDATADVMGSRPDYRQAEEPAQEDKSATQPARDARRERPLSGEPVEVVTVSNKAGSSHRAVDVSIRTAQNRETNRREARDTQVVQVSSRVTAKASDTSEE